MGRTIAPDLADEMKELAEFWEGDAQADRARAQFRALRAVARAARRLAALTESAHRNGCQTCGADWANVRAVARLDRVSAPARASGRDR